MEKSKQVAQCLRARSRTRSSQPNEALICSENPSLQRDLSLVASIAACRSQVFRRALHGAGWTSLVLLVLLSTGCHGTPTSGERRARASAEAITGKFRPQGQPPQLPELKEGAALEDYVRFAMLNQPQ